MHKLFDPIAERVDAACVADLLNSDEAGEPAADAASTEG